jgi:transcription elongation factor GreA
MPEDLTPSHPHLEDASLPPAGVTLTTAEYAALARELETLRSRHRAELADRLRLARTFGGAAESDDLLAVLEEAAIEEARIAHLEQQVRTARVIDVEMAGQGVAGLGATVRVADEAGRESQYELVGRRTPDSRRHDVTPASPVGEALMGSRAGSTVAVKLPSARTRMLRVLEVSYAPAAEAA